MRIAVSHATARQQSADLNQFVDDRGVGFAFLALVIKHAHVSEERDVGRSEEHTSELQSLTNLVCRLLLEKKKKQKKNLPDRKSQDHLVLLILLDT